MTQNYDTLNLGDLVTSDYLKNLGDINSKALEIMYKTKFRDDLTAQDMGVINTGATDASQVFELEAKHG